MMSDDFVIVGKKQKMIRDIFSENQVLTPSRFMTEEKIIENERGNCIFKNKNGIKNIKLIIFAFFPRK